MEQVVSSSGEFVIKPAACVVESLAVADDSVVEVELCSAIRSDGYTKDVCEVYLPEVDGSEAQRCRLV